MGIKREPSTYCKVDIMGKVCKQANSCKRYISKEDSEKVEPEYLVIEPVGTTDNCHNFQDKNQKL